MTLQDVANLISVRDFLARSIENLSIKFSREELKNVQTRIAYLDKTIVEQSLKLDLSKLGTDTTFVRKWEVSSTEDVLAPTEKESPKNEAEEYIR